METFWYKPYIVRGYDDDGDGWYEAFGCLLLRFYKDGEAIGRSVLRLNECYPEPSWLDRDDPQTVALRGTYQLDGSQIKWELRRISNCDDDRPVNWKYWGYAVPAGSSPNGEQTGILSSGEIRLSDGVTFYEIRGTPGERDTVQARFVELSAKHPDNGRLSGQKHT